VIYVGHKVKCYTVFCIRILLLTFLLFLTYLLMMVKTMMLTVKKRVVVHVHVV